MHYGFTAYTYALDTYKKKYMLIGSQILSFALLGFQLKGAMENALM